MPSCSRPSCVDDSTGYLLLHRIDRIAELLPAADPLGERYGIPLCETHLRRARAPEGWDLIDRLNPTQPVAPDPGVGRPSRPRVHGVAAAATGRPVWLPAPGPADEPVGSAAPRTPLLRRAFNGETVDPNEPEGQLRLSV